MDINEIERLLRVIRDNTGMMPTFQEPPPGARRTLYVCTTIEVDEEPTVADNGIAPCDWGCGRLIQFRAHAPTDVAKVCLYCMADRKLKDH